LVFVEAFGRMQLAQAVEAVGLGAPFYIAQVSAWRARVRCI
jgi:hypothetical protein